MLTFVSWWSHVGAKKPPAEERGYFFLKSCKVVATPCVLLGVLFLFFVCFFSRSGRRMINGGEGEKCEEDRQTDGQRNRTDREQGTVGLKYPMVAGRQGQRQGSPWLPPQADF